MRAAILWAAILVACHHAEAPSVAVLVTCGDQQRSLPVTSDTRIDETLCGQPWMALRIEHGPHTELVKAVPGREVWLRQNDGRVVIEVRAGSAMTSRFEGVTEIAEDPPRPAAATIQIDANGTVTDVTLDDLHARFETDGSAGRDISLCAVAEAYVPHARKIEVRGEAPDPIVVTAEDCVARELGLKISGKGELRLRAAGGEHLLQKVTRIRVLL